MEKPTFQLNLTLQSDSAVTADVKIKGSAEDIETMLAVLLVRRPDLMVLIHNALELMDDISCIEELTLPKDL
jgi:hypothetical protein